MRICGTSRWIMEGQKIFVFLFYFDQQAAQTIKHRHENLIKFYFILSLQFPTGLTFWLMEVAQSHYNFNAHHSDLWHVPCLSHGIKSLFCHLSKWSLLMSRSQRCQKLSQTLLIASSIPYNIVSMLFQMTRLSFVLIIIMNYYGHYWRVRGCQMLSVQWLDGRLYLLKIR